MMPPECCICNKEFLPQEGGLIYFVEDDEDKALNKRLKEDEMVGHPSNAFWFCDKHFQIAKNYKHLTKKVAFRLIKNQLP